MCSPGVTARDEVLAGLAALGPSTDAVTLLGQVRDLAGLIDRARGQLARLAGAVGGRWWAPPALDPGQLRHLGEELLYRADPDGVEERERKRFERRHLSFGFTLDGSGTITGATGDALSAEIIKTAAHAFGPPL